MMSKTSLKKAIEELEEIFFTGEDRELSEFILEAVEKPLVERLLERTGGDLEKAAKILKIDRKVLQISIKEIEGLRNKKNPKSEIKIRR